MYLRICMKTKFCELHFRGRSTLHKISEFYLSDHARQMQFGQNSILARSKAKIRNWKILNCFFYICAKPFSLTKNEGKLFLVPKSSGSLLERLPLKTLHSKTKCSIKHGFQRSKCFDYCNGVRQGCILSPMLFNLYLNEIPFLLDKQDTDPPLLPDGSSLNCLLYADDLVLILSSANGLQNALSTLSQFCRDWRMNINTKKDKSHYISKET